MNYYWAKREDFFPPGNSQGSQGFQISHQIDHNLKPRAYINPKVLNYEYIKRSLTKGCIQASTKIHVNPNFKGNSLNHLQKSLEIKNCVNAPAVNLNLHHTAIREPGPSNISSYQDGSLPSVGAKGNESVTNCISATRYKKINNVNLYTGSRSKFSWSKTKNNAVGVNSESTFKKKFFTQQSSQALSEKSCPFTSTQSIYKYTAPKKICRVVHPKSKNSLPEKNSVPMHMSKIKIVNKSRTKLINTVPPKNKLVCKPAKIHLPIQRHTQLSRFTYSKNKKSLTTKMAILVRNKYKYSNITTSRQYKNSKYKLDKRNKLNESVKKKSSRVQDIRKLFPINFQTQVTSYKRGSPYYSCSTSRNVHFWRNNLGVQKERGDRFPNRRVVKIGGILYKSTANKLTLANKKNQTGNLKKSITNKEKGKNHIVYVRGEKFILDKNGKTLKRHPQNIGSNKVSLNTPQRIDIGGVTYMQTSKNVLIRTNVHQARHLVNKARNKSIAVLTNLYRRSAMPCMIYHKFGRCIRHTNGSCMYKHDPKNIALCKKFLKGNCENKNCLLSHEVIQEKMAVCHFFLNGFCARENCPFLHVKLNENTAICKNFLQGFCTLGKNCSERHFYQCPEFDKHGTCSLGTKCHYPHKVFDKTEKLSKDSHMNSDKPKEENEVVQYYVKNLDQRIKKKKGKIKRSLTESKLPNQNKKAGKKGTKNKRSLNVPDQSSGAIECVPKRIKLDKLPCYIPLKLDP